MERIVRNEVLRDVLVEDAPVARLVLVARLDVAADQILVLFQGHPASPPRSLAVAESTARRSDEGVGCGGPITVRVSRCSAATACGWGRRVLWRWYGDLGPLVTKHPRSAHGADDDQPCAIATTPPCGSGRLAVPRSRLASRAEQGLCWRRDGCSPPKKNRSTLGGGDRSQFL